MSNFNRHLLDKLPSERAFGFLFTVAFALGGSYCYFISYSTIVVASHALAATILLCVTLFFPRLLRPLNKGWFELGLLLGRIVNPIVLGIFFFFVITPIAMVTRLFGRDELKTKKRIVDSYWIERIPPGPKGESFNHKF